MEAPDVRHEEDPNETIRTRNQSAGQSITKQDAICLSHRNLRARDRRAGRHEVRANLLPDPLRKGRPGCRASPRGRGDRGGQGCRVGVLAGVCRQRRGRPRRHDQQRGPRRRARHPLRLGSEGAPGPGPGRAGRQRRTGAAVIAAGPAGPRHDLGLAHPPSGSGRCLHQERELDSDEAQLKTVSAPTRGRSGPRSRRRRSARPSAASWASAR